MKPITVDAHHHLWRLGGALDYGWLDGPGLEPIRRTFSPEDLLPRLQDEAIDRSIFVQTLADLDETRWALEQTTLYPFIAGVVGWVDLRSHDCRRQVEEFRQHPRFVGVRHVVHDEPDVDFIVRPETIRGLRVLESLSIPYDLLLRVEHLHHVPTLAKNLPNLPMVIDHLAKPFIKARRIEGWLELIREASRCPNVSCKLSGMVTEADHRSWTVEDLRPYVETALDLFGPARLMFGSDWPVCELAASYGQVHRSLRGLLQDLSASENAAIFGMTAAKFYQLPADESFEVA